MCEVPSSTSQPIYWSTIQSFHTFLFLEIKRKKKILNAFFVERNRYNLRTSSANPPTDDEKNSDENADNVSNVPSSTTPRALRRIPFNLRGRSRPTTAAPASNENPEEAISADAQDDTEKQQSTTVPTALKPASRFNLRGPNRLLSNRARVSPLLRTAATTEATKTDGNSSTDAEKELTAVTAVDNKDSSADEGEQANSETSTQPQTGLNRLKNRPRIQIKQRDPKAEVKTSTTSPYNVNRKVNPLISRRKQLGTSTTTTGWLDFLFFPFFIFLLVP